MAAERCRLLRGRCDQRIRCSLGSSRGIQYNTVLGRAWTGTETHGEAGSCIIDVGGWNGKKGSNLKERAPVKAFLHTFFFFCWMKIFCHLFSWGFPGSVPPPVCINSSSSCSTWPRSAVVPLCDLSVCSPGADGRCDRPAIRDLRIYVTVKIILVQTNDDASIISFFPWRFPFQNSIADVLASMLACPL